MSHQVTSLSWFLSVSSLSSYFFLLPRALSSHWPRALLLFFFCGIRKRARPDLEIESFAGDRGFEKRRRTEPRLDRETRRPRDHETSGLELQFWLRFFLFFCSALLFFFFGNVGFGCGFPVHSFGFFVWLLEVLMVVDSGFVVGGGDEIGFGCGFHVLRVESQG